MVHPVWGRKWTIKRGIYRALENGERSLKELADLTHLTERELRRHLRELRRYRLVCPGSRKSTWQVCGGRAALDAAAVLRGLATVLTDRKVRFRKERRDYHQAPKQADPFVTRTGVVMPPQRGA
jgi:DNA-binding transcriptional ArsR family regulator